MQKTNKSSKTRYILKTRMLKNADSYVRVLINRIVPSVTEYSEE